MARVRVFSIAMVTALAFSLSPYTGESFAMGANGGPLAPQENTKDMEEGTGKDEKKLQRSGEDTTGKGKEEGQTEKSSPKKPRIKYRDIYECGC